MTRARRALLLLVLIPLALLPALSGCGGGRSHGQGPAVTVVLHGGSSATISACGAAHHYRTYAAGAAVKLSGSVTPVPSGRWKVKLALKRCSGGSFVPVSKLATVRDRRTGEFTGGFAAPAPGDYSIRAELYLADGSRVRSPKRHFATR